MYTQIDSDNYQAKLDLEKFNTLMNKEYLSKVEREFCIRWDINVALELVIVGDGDNVQYLNLTVYCEQKHHNIIECMESN